MGVPVVSLKLVGVSLACLPHIAKREAVARQRHNGNVGLSAQVRPALWKESLQWVWQPYLLLAWPALVRCFVSVVHSRGVSHPSSCQVHRKCPPEHRRAPFHVHPGKRPPESPGSRSLHRLWPHPLVPVRRRHPRLGLSACSKHVALTIELECAWTKATVSLSYDNS